MAAEFRVRVLCSFVLAVVMAAASLSAYAQTGEDTPEAKIAAATKIFEEATTLGNQGDEASVKEAIKKLESIEPVFEKYNDQMKLAGALGVHGSYLVNLIDPPAGLQMLNRALAIYKTLGYPPGQATILFSIGSYYYRQKDLTHARDALEESRVQIEKQPLPPFDLKIYNALGNLYIDLQDRTKATEVLWQAYQVANKRSEDEAITALVNYADAQEKLNTPKFALSFYETALKRAQTAKLTSREISISVPLINLCFNLGEREKAKNYIDQAWAKVQTSGTEAQKCHMLKFFGYYAYVSVRMEEALGYYQRAAAIAEKNRYDDFSAAIDYDIGLVYGFLNDYKTAAIYFSQSISLAHASGDKLTELYALGSLGKAQVELGDEGLVQTYTAALALANELIANSKISKVRAFALGLMNDFGNFALRMGRNETAVEIFTKALAAARNWQLPVEETSLINNLAYIYQLNGDYKTALEYFNNSLILSRSMGNKYAEAITLSNLMSLWSKLGNPRFASFFGKSSINIFQDFRKGMQGLSMDERQSYLKTVEDHYRKFASLLISQGRIAEAEQVLTMLKEEELIDYVRRDDAVAKQMLDTMTLSDDEKASITRYGAIAEQITALGKELAELEEERKASTDAVFAKQKRYDEVKQLLADASTAFEKFLEELKLKFGQNDTRVAMVDSSLKSTLDRLKASHTAAVSTIVGKDELNIIVTTRKTQRAHTVKVSAEMINELVGKFHTALSSSQYDPRPIGQKLYDLIVKPIEGDLAGIKADTILWSLDGSLRYIPPAAFWDKTNGYMVERFANVMVNLASRETLLLGTKEGQKLSVLGVGVSKPTEGFSALTAVPDELDCIVSDKSVGMLSAKPQCSNGVLAGRKLLDDNFTLSNFEGQLGRFPIVHIASHFKLTPGDDKNSFLLLGGGTDRKFTVEKLRTEPLTDIDLIVLSACNTATPTGSRTNGVEIEGFGSIAQKEGAKAVMATLWSVADSSTKDFMVEFYRLYGKEGLSKADAMRRAQLKLMYGKYSANEAQKHRADDFVTTTDDTLPKFTPDPNAPFAHPYFWSPFTLIGNWR
jgi:CHAT domain-containing protein